MTTPDLSAFVTPCPDCKQPIMWPRTVTGQRMPVDAEAVPGGNVMVTVNPSGENLGCDVVNRADSRRLAAGGHLLYRHHRITCTKADRWARPHRKPAPAVSTAEGLF